MQIPKVSIEFYYAKLGRLVAGIDEVGRGSLAGPVVSAIVVMSPSVLLQKKWSPFKKVRDSKLLTSKQRNILYKQITQTTPYAIGVSSCKEIDMFGIRYATYLSMRRAINNIMKLSHLDILLVDGRSSVINLPFDNTYYFTNGDAYIFSISMASIIAKVYRDRLMERLHKEYPKYNWFNNKGYGTAEHRDAIKAFGRTPYHRRSFLRNI